MLMVCPNDEQSKNVHSQQQHVEYNANIGDTLPKNIT